MSWSGQSVRRAHGANRCQTRQGRGLPILLSALLCSASVAALIISPGRAEAQSTWQGTTSDYNTNSNWDNSTAPISSGQSAIFGSAGGATVNVSSAVSPDSWTFNSSSQSYQISGSAVTFGGAGIVDSASGQYITISNNLGGVGGVAVHDTTGLLVLGGSNTYAGATTIDSGATLVAGSATAFSANSAHTVNGYLDLAGFNNTLGPLSGYGIVFNNGFASPATLTVNVPSLNYGAFYGVIEDGSSQTSLAITGNGPEFLAANNTYSGTTTINSGATLEIGLGGIYGTLGTGNVTDTGDLQFFRSNTVTVANAISGSGELDQVGSGTLILTGANSYSTTYIGSGGTLQVGNGGTTGTLGMGVILDAGTLVFDHADNIAISNGIVGSGGLTQAGADTLTLGGFNNYSGATIVNTVATLAAGSTTAFSSASDFTVNGTLDLNGFSNGIGSLSGDGVVTNNGGSAATLAVGANSASTTFSGTLRDGASALALEVTGGSLTLTGTNNYSGGATIDSGATLTAGSTAAFTTNSGFTVNGTLDLGGFSNSVGSLSGSGIVTNNGGTIATLTTGGNNASTAFSGNLQDGAHPLALTATGAGTLTLTGNNTNSGATVIDSGATLQIGDNATTGSLGSGSVTNNGTLIFNRSDSVTVGNVISGSGSVTFEETGGYTLTGNNTYTGTTTIREGAILVGNGGTTGSIAGNVVAGVTTSGSGINFDRSDDITFGGNISGMGYVAQLGSGTLTLTGTNSYGSTTDIENGRIAISSDSNLGAGDVRMIGGNGIVYTGSFTSTHNYELGAGSSFDTGANTVAISGVLSTTSLNLANGQGGITKLGAGTLILTGNNTYTGNTIISAGTLQIGNGGTSGNLSAATNGATITDNGTLAIDRSDTVSISNSILGVGSLTQMGNGTTVLLAPGNSFSGGITISAGTLQIGSIGNNGSLGTGNVTDNSSLSFSPGGFITVSNNISGSGSLTVLGNDVILTGNNTYTGGTIINAGGLQIGLGGGTTGSIDGNVTDNGTISFDRADSTTFSGTITGSGIVQIAGGTLTLTGANGYSGGTYVYSHAAISSDGNLGIGNVILQGIITFDASYTSTHNYPTVGSGTFDSNGNIVTLSGAVEDQTGTTGGLTKAGAGTLILTGSNTYTGGTTINAGTLRVGSGGVIGNISAANVTDNGTLTFDRSDTVTFANVISGTGNLIQLGAGTLILSSPFNSYGGGTTIGSTIQLNNGGTLGSGQVVDNGQLIFNSSGTYPNAISGTGSVTASNGTVIWTGNSSYGGGTTINGGASLQIGAGETSGSITSNVTDNGTLIFDRSDSVNFSTPITGAGSLVQSGSGTLILTGSNSYGGSTTIYGGGTLQVGNGGSNGALGSGSITDNGTLAYNLSTPVNVSTSISGGGGLTQMGSGTLTVSSAQTYFGSTAVATGSMMVLTGAASIVNSSGVLDSGSFDISTLSSPSITIQALSGSGTVNLGSKLLIISAGSGVGGSNNFSGSFTGSGSMEISGGSTVLTNVTNPITVDSRATLDIEDGTYAGSNITDNGTVIINRSTTTSIDNISGNGVLRLEGFGTVTSSSTTTLSTIFVDAGPLQITGGGSYPVNSIIDNSALVFNLTGSTVAGILDSNISGGGTVTLAGGTLDITGTETYTGTATIASGGSLQVGDGSTHGSIDPNAIVNNGQLFFVRSDTVLLPGNLSGSGTLYQSGTGTMILTGTNTSTGGIIIDSRGSFATNGTLQIGNGGTGGGLGSGAVTDNGALVFDHSDNLAVANVISGSGSLTQMGSGALILTGANGYTGVTTVNTGGTLQIGNGGTGGVLGPGTLTDNGGLIFDRSDAVTIPNTISGTGTLTQAGSGTLILDGTNTFTGTTNVTNGILEIGDGAHPSASIGGSVNVASGGALYGHGTVGGAVSVTPGGSLRPGGTIGTLTVNGNLSMAAGSTFVAELSPTAADQVIVGGAATLGGNLNLIADPGTYSAGSDFKLISAASVTGAFASVTGQVAGFTNTVQYSATGVDLILSTPAAAPTTFLFGSYGTTPNQTAAGNALTAGSASGSLYTAMDALVGSGAASVPGALGQLAGDIRPSLRAAAIEDSRIIRDTLLDHMDHAGTGLTLWGASFAGYGRLASDGNAANLHHESAGFLAGVDMPVLSNVILGVAGGYSSNNARTPGNFSTASGDGGHIGAYAAWNPGDLRFDIGGDYGFGSVTINRTVPQLGVTTIASQDQETGQVFADLGYDIPLDGAALEPHAAIAHIIATSGAFNETGSIAALSGNEKSDSATYSLLGVRANLADMALGDNMTLAPRLDLGWQHALARLTPYQTVSYVNAGTSFAVLGTPLAQDAAALQAGFDLKVSPSATLFVSYDGSYSSRVENHAFRGGLSWRF